ncbi:MAG: hypothetical protein PHD29_05920 [bacterium]|nr:hypothetical protein [bacterium]
MAIKKTAGIVTPKVTTNPILNNKQVELKNGIVMPKASNIIVSSAAIEPKTDIRKGIPTPAVITTPIAPPGNKPSEKK